MDCELCGGELVYLGTLGYLAHFTCRDCGMESSTELFDADDALSDRLDAEFEELMRDLES